MSTAPNLKYVSQMNISYDPAIADSSFIEVANRIKMLNKLPFYNCDINYTDDLWDFSPYKQVNVHDTCFKIRFDVNECFADAVKAYALLMLLRGHLKMQYLSNKVSIVCSFLRFQYAVGCIAIQDISLFSIQSYFDNSNQVAITTSTHTKRHLLHFLRDYSTLISPYTLDPEIISYLSLTNSKELNAYRESAKLPDIPDAYFNELLKVTLHVIKSNDVEDVKHHHVANLLLILMQTGIRIGELCALKTDCIKVITFNNKRMSYLRYTTWKREKGTNVTSQAEIFANDYTEFAINNLITEFADLRKRCHTDYLFIDPFKKRSYPITGNEFYGILRRYYYYINKYMQTIDLPDDVFPELRRTRVQSFIHTNDVIQRDPVLIHPVSEQYRVHVCTQLYQSGVSLEYIARYMSHLSKTMEAYYIRPKVNTQEDIDFSRTILEGIISGQLDPLGGKNSIMTRISQFIEVNNYNVNTDMNKICDELLKTVPIRQKCGGVCIKSSVLRDCSVDAATNEFYCAYNVCPNIYHFYYMIPITLKQARDLAAGLKINTANGFTRQAEKDRNMLRTLSKQKLLPELESLQKHLATEGSDAILQRYPDLADIISDFNSIYTEAQKWTRK